MKHEKTFAYGGYHFTHIRQFRKDEGDFFAISRRLESDMALGFSTYPERQKFQYDYEAFYKAATDKDCDLFRCEETGKIYMPGKNELFLYHEPQQKTKASVMASLEKGVSKQSQNNKKTSREPER